MQPELPCGKRESADAYAHAQAHESSGQELACGHLVRFYDSVVASQYSWDPRGAVTAPAMIAFELEAIAGDGGGGEASATEDSFSARSPELDAQGCGTKHLQHRTTAPIEVTWKPHRHRQ